MLISRIFSAFIMLLVFLSSLFLFSGSFFSFVIYVTSLLALYEWSKLLHFKSLEKNIKRWNERYQLVERSLKKIKGVQLTERPIEESYVGSSIQFRLPGISKADAARFLVINKERGVEIKWFGSDNPNGFTSNHKSWKYVKQQSLERSDEILSGLFDLRLPPTFSLEDCSLLSEIIGDCAEAFVSKNKI